MQNTVENVFTMNSSNCMNTPIEAKFKRTKFKRTVFSAKEMKYIAGYNQNLENDRIAFRIANQKAMKFITDKGMLHEFMDFINPQNN